MEYPAFIGPSYQSQAVTFDQEQTMNWYVEPAETPGATSRAALYPTPGVEFFTEGGPGIGFVATGVGRAHFSMTFGGEEREFAVIGPSFCEVRQDGSLGSVRTVADDGLPATITSNGDAGGQVFICSGGNGYILDLNTNSFSQVLTGTASMGDHLDGYFLALDRNTSTLRVSELLNGTVWPGTQFAQRSAATDPWTSLKVVNKYIWLLGTQTSEVWYDAGTSPVPFAPDVSAGLLPYGCAAPFSVAQAEAAIIWLGRSAAGAGQVIRSAGFTPEIVSTFPVTNAFNTYTSLDDAIGDTYSDRGHTFFVLTFPSADHTWSWDFQTEQWHERGTWISEENRFQAWRPLFHAFAFGQHRMLDRSGSLVYLMSSDLAFDVEEREIRRVRRAPAMVNELKRLFFSDFELDLEPGLGLTIGQGSDPQVMLRMSNDGGKTWSFETMRSAGKRGEYGRRVRWNRCGSARRRVFEVSVSDPIPWKLTNAFIDVKGEAA